MDIGMIGLGRMGGNMAERLLRHDHRVVGFDPNAEARKTLVDKGAGEAASLDELVGKLPSPRVIWMMVPAGKITEDTVQALQPLLSSGDIVIDGGNAYYKDTQRRAEALAERGIHYVDCGTSGGVWGLAEGYSMMIGGADEAIAQLKPIFEALAPAPDQGWGHVGPVGAGHFTKMVHNGVEYGLMQAYAEGFSILQHKQEFKLDLHQVAVEHVFAIVADVDHLAGGDHAVEAGDLRRRDALDLHARPETGDRRADRALRLRRHAGATSAVGRRDRHRHRAQAQGQDQLFPHRANLVMHATARGAAEKSPDSRTAA